MTWTPGGTIKVNVPWCRRLLILMLLNSMVVEFPSWSSTVVESIGETIHLIPGDPVNLKITHPYDLAVAEYLFAKSHC